MKAIFPGSFDPIHDGHINIIKKASALFEKLYVVVSFNLEKQEQTDIETRTENVKIICAKLANNIEVISNNTMLTSELAEQIGANYIIRGLRNTNDLKYEMELAFANKQLNQNLETVFFIADYGLNKISSTLLKQINKLKK